MHEAALAESLVRTALEAAAGNGGRVVRLTVLVGELAGVLPEALTFAFDALKRGTRLANATLWLERQRVLAVCEDCAARYEPEGFPFLCPACQSRFFRIERGEEVLLKELEMES